MVDKTLDLLREGKLNIGADGNERVTAAESTATNPSIASKKGSKEEKKKREKSKAEKSKAASRTTSRRDEDIDEDSDGGFFEE